jgi:replication factor C subunit 3/5
MHLNASDERGVDTIRIQINQFVNSMNLFESGIKLIILDEVDYMTITAQKALKTLIQSCRDNVKFCIICNYISKIDESLKNEFINIRFNQLPQDYTLNFIKKIAIAESVDIDDDTILAIQKIYETDIRSTINFIQLNRALKQEWKFKILNDEVFQYIHSLMLNYDAEKDADNRSMDTIIEVMHNTLVRYNIDNFTFIQKYFKYIIKNHTDLVTDEFLTVVSNVIHDSSNINTTDLNGMLYITSQNYFQNIKLNCLTCYLYTSII